MAGNRNRTEALVSLVCNEVDESTGGVVDSLEGVIVTSLQDSAVCYIRATNENFRWDQTSVAAPSASVILPFGQDLSVPGRWILITGGGGGGGITTITGSGGISIANPGGPSTNVSGSALYARDASNGAMLANMSMGGFSITNVIGLSSAAALAIAATGNLTLSGNGGTALRWPSADGTVGQAMVTNGAGVLSFATISGGGAPTMQSVTAAGPTNVTDTTYTIALVNFAGAAAVVLPPVASGKIAIVKDVSGNAAANNITVTPASGTIDGAASQIIATDYGSMTFVSNGTNWFVL